MKKSQLREIILETLSLRGHSPQIGQTKGGTTDDFRNILTAIAKGRPEEGDPVRGNKILDKANPDNVARITRGEKPIYESEKPTGTLTASQVKTHIKDLAKNSPKTTVKLSYVGGDGNRATATNSAENWIKKFNDISGGSFTKEGEHSFKTTGKLYKSDTATPPKDSAVRAMMSSKK
jgi:hypothetical protein